MKLLYIYLILVNLAAFCLMGADKRRASRHRWRIPERALLLPAWAGGSVGAVLGMWVFRHKTRHRQFALGLPVLMAVHVVLFLLFLRPAL